MALPDESASFLYILYIVHNILYTAPKRSRKDMFDNNSNDEYYFKPDKIEDDNSASDNGNELRSTRMRLRRFNISSKLNTKENTSLNNE